MAKRGATLEYSPRRRRGVRRWRAWILVAAAVALAGGVLRYGKPIARRFDLVRWQDRCLAYTQSPLTLATARRSVAHPDYVPVPGFGGPAPFVLSPQCWRKFSGLVSPGPVTTPTLFLHELTSAAGHRRLVHVAVPDANALTPDAGYDVTVIKPGSLWHEPVVVGRQPVPSWAGSFMPAELYFGQPDPADASHFTVVLKGSQRVLEGWLCDDDKVKFWVER